jgi:hypothetical protein
MKRSLFLLACSLMLLFAAATPALADEPPVANIDVTVWDAATGVDFPVGISGLQEVPYGYTFQGFLGWYGYTRGLIQTAPTTLLTWYDLYKDGADQPFWSVTPKSGRQYWGGLTRIDPVEWELTPFNPRIGAPAYWIEYTPQLGVLEPGTYLAHLHAELAHPTHDMMGVSARGHGPAIYTPGPPYDDYVEFEVVEAALP